jgi:prolyl-tRNA synthetase
LIGIPHRVVIGERGLKENQVEYQARTETAAQTVALNDIVIKLQRELC